MASKKHRQSHKEFTDTFSSSTVQNWHRMVENWQDNPKALNPFEEPIASRCSVILYKFKGN